MTDRELATVLAALRHWQVHYAGQASEAARRIIPQHDIASDGETLKPLTVHEIDGLCERLNRPTAREQQRLLRERKRGPA